MITIQAFTAAGIDAIVPRLRRGNHPWTLCVFLMLNGQEIGDTATAGYVHYYFLCSSMNLSLLLTHPDLHLRYILIGKPLGLLGGALLNQGDTIRI